MQKKQQQQRKLHIGKIKFSNASKRCTVRARNAQSVCSVGVFFFSFVCSLVANAHAKNSSTYRMAQVFVHSASDNNHWLQFKHFVHTFFLTSFFRLLPTSLHFAIFLRSFFYHSDSLFHDVIMVLLHVRRSF